MAYEASEIMTAAALMYKTTELEKIETEGDLQRLKTDSKKNLDKFVVFGDRAEFDSLRLESGKISTIDSNQDLVLEAPGTGSVQINDNVLITQASADPTAPSGGIKIYNKDQGTGNTGLYFVNKDSTRDEIISNNRALVYSMVF